MLGNDEVEGGWRTHGPWIWVISLIAGVALGATLAHFVPGVMAEGKPVAPLWLVGPFAALLASIALMPFVSERVWHRHFPDFSFFLGGLVAGYVLWAYPEVGLGRRISFGQYAVLHAFLEYYSFVALVCGLYVVSGGILIKIKGRGTPMANVCLLAFGAVFANVVGTTGASMLLLRPFMRLNEGRVRPIHIVLFIMIVSNCAGCLTPIGDPPLYLGYLKGVDFFYPMTHFWPEWLFVVGSLIAVFGVIDARYHRRERLAAANVNPELLESQGRGVSVSGGSGLFALGLMIFGVFIDPMVKKWFGIEGIPFGATFQILVATGAYFAAKKEIHEANQFSFFPVKEVGLLFMGIFMTMIPALAYLAQHGASMGLDHHSKYYFATGALSSVLDNAPTYLNFLQIALAPADVNPASIAAELATPEGRITIAAISTGSVFFGAMTYIGNGPNFMVRTIAQSAGVKMPSFFGYVLWAVVLLLPILVLNWLFLIR
ncbi:MAG: sodium:proton antiporter [Planctomycetes bacterium]|nr:sodium:proton antiporter [Planctomycetota bacterium]